MKKIGLIIMALTISSILAADVSKVGTTAASFLTIGVGARATAMGGAFVGVADDASALYWNPAGIARSQNVQAVMMHCRWLADLRYNFVGFSMPVAGLGSVGASITSLNYGEMPVRTVDEPDGTGEFFSSNDLAMALTCGRQLTDRFSIGFNVKYITQRIWHESASSFAVDFGTLFVTGLHGLRIGATLSNFGTDMRMEGKDLLVFYDVDANILGNNDRVPAHLQTEKWPLPLMFQFGLAMEPWKTAMHRLTIAADAIHPSDNTESFNAGFEYGFREMIFLRAGFRDLLLRDREQGLALGAGFAMRKIGNVMFQIDYAYADFGRLENAQRFSLNMAF
jgi:hypothetical protein